MIKNRVLVFGKFDILHPGHMHILKMAKKFGQLTVVLESDQAIRELRQYLPYNNQLKRKKKLEAMGFDVFVRYTRDQAQQIVDKLQPDILCIGEDQEYLKNTFSQFKNLKIEYIDFIGKEIFRSSKLRSVLNDKNAGLYLIDKNKGATSFSAVSALRKILNTRQVGFSGTLDPLASGLMILASGKATRLLDWPHSLSKTYVADIVFGQSSASYDLETELVVNEKAKSFSKEELQKNIKKFVGLQKQQAPIFSAKKNKGQRLYDLARSGRTVAAPSKEINIYDLKIQNFKYPNLKLQVTVSAGTYIRSLANDLGKAMKTGAVLVDLRRIKIGPFELKKALELEELSASKLTKNRITPQKFIEILNQYLD